MIETTLQSVFYSRILPNSAAGVISVLVILAFRQFTKHWSKGYVRMLWILLTMQLLAPPLFHSSWYTVRDFGVKISGIRTDQQETANGHTDELLEADNQTAAYNSLDQSTKEQAVGRISQPDGKDSKGGDRYSQTADAQRNESVPTETGQRPSGYLRSESGWWFNTVFGRLFDARGMEFLSHASIWAARLWIAGVFAWAAYYFYLYLQLKKSLRSAFCVYGQGYWVSEAASVPFVMPGIPPKIYLPAGMDQMQQDDILAHERQHIRNLDPLLKCAALLTAIIYWFHPLVWIAVSLFGKDMEMYCDECVLRGKSLAQRKAYSRTLLEFASKTSGFTLTMNFAKSNVERRIHHILNVKKPHRAVCLLLTAFVGMSGFSFLSAKNVEGKAGAVTSQEKNDGAKQSDGTNTRQPAYRQDARKFAKRIVRLVKSGDKKAFAKMVAFPILVYLDGEETNIVDAESFISYYGQIADKKWKSAVLGADIDGLSSNYMGYNIGDGAAWFSTQIGREGYWIYAINNPGEDRFAGDLQDTQKAWEKLALSQGMPKEEARRWYIRFAKDGLCENGLNFRFTGCAYGDFDGNGANDVFVISSLSPHEKYPESATETMDINGYINGEWIYTRGFQAVSQNGFQQFDVKAGKRPGISCTIQFAADTGKLEEDQYLLEIGTKGWVVSGTCLTEAEKVVHMLAQIPKEKYQSAISYDERRYMEEKEWGKNRVVLLQSIPEADIRMYGYDGEEYGTRGIIVDYKGTYSFFDMLWDSYHFAPQMYQGDYDEDSMQEFAVIYPYGYGTGISWEGLLVFDVQPDNTLLCSEMIMDHRYLESQLEPFIKYDKKNGKIKIIKDGKTKKVIDLTDSPDYQENKENLVIAYTNLIQFKVEGNRIKMLTDVMGSLYGTTLYLEGVENMTTAFDVIYSSDGFQFDLAD